MQRETEEAFSRRAGGVHRRAPGSDPERVNLRSVRALLLLADVAVPLLVAAGAGRALAGGLLTVTLVLCVGYVCWPAARRADALLSAIEHHRTASHRCTLCLIRHRVGRVHDGFHGIFAGPWADDDPPAGLLARRAAHDARVAEMEREREALPDASLVTYVRRVLAF